MKTILHKRWAVVLLAVLIVVVIGGWGTLQYTCTPGFCQSCHIMDPYYESWQASAHSKVACVDCHYAPGEKFKLSSKVKALNQVVQYMTGTYDTKFYTEITDDSCLTSGCHDAGKLGGRVMFDDKVKFDHSAHYGKAVRGITLRCTSCHTHNVKGSHMAADRNACFLCHFKDKVTGVQPVPQQFCLDCHDAPSADIEMAGQTYNHTAYIEQKVDCQRCHLDAIEGQGAVDPNACLQCHEESKLPELTADLQNVHKTHVTEHKVDCYRCHSEIKHGVHLTTDQVKFTCGQCHSDTHLGPRELYAGTGGRGVTDMPSSMYQAQVDCVGCHLDEFSDGLHALIQGKVMRPTVKGCVDCHGDAGKDFFQMWNDTLAESVAETSLLVSRAQTKLGLADSSKPGYGELSKLVEDAQFNLDFVTYGKGIHNFNYSMELLAKAREYAEQAIAGL